MKFSIKKKYKNARSGYLELKNGNVQTPTFMTIGTYGSVKSLSSEDLLRCDVKSYSVMHITSCLDLVWML